MIMDNTILNHYLSFVNILLSFLWIAAVNTARPAAGAAHAAFELRDSLLDTDIPRLRFLARSDPANPLVARERCDAFPNCSRGRRLN